MADQSLLGTLTGEHFQPVRLHYRVLNHPGLKQAFEKLRCLEYDAPRKRWVWLYAHEAKNLRFQRSYAQFPKELHPKMIFETLTSRSEEPLPQIERLPVHYAEDGIDGFNLALQLGQIVAKEHLLGNPGYTLGDAIKAVTKSLK